MQEALAQHAALLWGLLQPGPLAVAAQDGRRRAGSHPSLPFWLNDAPCDLPQQRLLRPGAPAAAQAAAAEELLRRLEEGVEHWERERGLDAAARGLAAAAPDVQPALPMRRGSGSEPTGSSKAAPAQKRGRGRPRKAVQAKAPPQPAPATAAHAAADTLAGAAPVQTARPPSQQGDVSAWLGAEVLLPAIDACCTAVQWLAQAQEGPGAEPPAGGLKPGVARLALACSRPPPPFGMHSSEVGCLDVWRSDAVSHSACSLMPLFSTCRACASRSPGIQPRPQAAAGSVPPPGHPLHPAAAAPGDLHGCAARWARWARCGRG